MLMPVKLNSFTHLEVTFREAVPILCRYGYVTFVSDTGHFPSRDVFGPTYKYHAGHVPKLV